MQPWSYSSRMRPVFKDQQLPLVLNSSSPIPLAIPREPIMPKGLESCCKVFKMFKGDEDKVRNKMRQDGIPQDRFDEIPAYFESLKDYT
eukprot:UN19242